MSVSSIVPAATVLLLRDGSQGLEVFMVARHPDQAAFSGALVFPGGQVDAPDHSHELHQHCRRSDDLDARALAFRVAAIREVFEECGILLAYARGEADFITAERVSELADYRSRLCTQSMTILELCQREKLELAIDRLVPYAHWITPNIRPKQFDTHFFLIATPADQIASHDGSETLDSVWITPTQALHSADTEQFTVVFPTHLNLIKLARSANTVQALAQAASTPIVTVQPQVAATAQGHIMSIPQTADYGVSQVLVNESGQISDILA